MTRIRDALVDFNPWWKEKFSIQFKERSIYQEIKRYIPLPQMISFTGLRRVGKTTLMYKIVEDKIKEGFNPKNIIYFSFDDFLYSGVRDIIKEYEGLMEKDLRKEKYLLLIDEIQKVDDWEDQLKRIYDAFGKNVKIIISGSESLFIKRKSKETLAGRLYEFKVKQLTFLEFLEFKGFSYKPIGLHERELKNLFEEFMISFGFPEIIGIKDKEVIKKYIRENIIEKTIYRDLVLLFKIRDVSVLEALINIIMEEPGQMMNLNEVAGELGISRQTLSNYIYYLEESFFIKKLYNFSKNRRKVEKKLKKYYPSLLSPNILFKDDEFSRSNAFECVCVNQIGAEFFWRDAYKNEVDAVLVNEKTLPVEIKYGKIDTKGLVAFMSKFKIKEGIIISREREETIKRDKFIIKVIPAYKYFLM